MKEDIKNYPVTSENENTTFENVQDSAKQF